MTSPCRAIALLTATMLAYGCWRSTPAAAPPSPSMPLAAAAEHETWRTWRAVGHQFDSSSSWELVMTIDRGANVGAQLGTIAYPTLGCSGVLERQPDQGSALVAVERLTEDPDHRCIDGGTITLSRTHTGETLDWSWSYPTGQPGARARC